MDQHEISKEMSSRNSMIVIQKSLGTDQICNVLSYHRNTDK